MTVREQDFETVREEWNEYRLLDGGKVRVKVSVNKLQRVLDEAGQPAFTPDGDPQVIVQHAVLVSASDS